jgi:hypothetical protein
MSQVVSVGQVSGIILIIICDSLEVQAACKKFALMKQNKVLKIKKCFFMVFVLEERI